MTAEELARDLLDEQGVESALATARRCLAESVRDSAADDIRLWRRVIAILESPSG